MDMITGIPLRVAMIYNHADVAKAFTGGAVSDTFGFPALESP